MAVTVPVPGPTPLTPVANPLITQRPAPTLPFQTATEGGNVGPAAVPNTNGAVPDTFYGVASPGAGTGVKPTVVNATQGPAVQDDLHAVNGQASTGGTYSELGYSYSSTLFTPPDPEAALVTFAGQVTGANSGKIPAYAGGTTYAKGDRVAGTTAGTAPFYQSLVAGNVGNTPASSPTKWQPIGTTAVTQGPGGGWGYAFANPGLLPLYNSGTSYVKGDVVGYVSVNSTYYIAPIWATLTAYNEGTFVIGSDNLVYVVLQTVADTQNNDPTDPATHGVFYDQTYTTWDAGLSFIKGAQVLKDGVCYVAKTAQTANSPLTNSTIWGSGATVVAWSATTFAQNLLVSYNDSVWISLASGGAAATNIPGDPLTGAGFWGKVPVAPFDDARSYAVGEYVTQSSDISSVLTTKLYICQTSHPCICTNPRVNNTQQLNAQADNQFATPIWAPVGYGVVVPFIFVHATASGETPDAENDLIGTAYWNYLGTAVAGNGTGIALAGDSQLGRESIGYGPLVYPEGTEYSDWQMGSYFGPAAVGSPTSRTDFSTIVASVSFTAAQFSTLSATATNTVYGAITVKDNNGNLLTPGQRGVPKLTASSATAAKATVASVVDGMLGLTAVAAGTTVVTVTCGPTKSISVTVTVGA